MQHFRGSKHTLNYPTYFRGRVRTLSIPIIYAPDPSHTLALWMCSVHVQNVPITWRSVLMISAFAPTRFWRVPRLTEIPARRATTGPTWRRWRTCPTTSLTPSDKSDSTISSAPPSTRTRVPCSMPPVMRTSPSEFSVSIGDVNNTKTKITQYFTFPFIFIVHFVYDFIVNIL